MDPGDAPGTHGPGVPYRGSPRADDPPHTDGSAVLHDQVVYAAGPPEVHCGKEWLFVPEQGWLALKSPKGAAHDVSPFEPTWFCCMG